MGFRKPNFEDAYSVIRTALVEINSPYNDGWTQMRCKHELYLLKCWLEDTYQQLPTFEEDERKWEQQRIVELLSAKRKSNGINQT